MQMYNFARHARRRARDVARALLAREKKNSYYSIFHRNDSMHRLKEAITSAPMASSIWPVVHVEPVPHSR